MRRKTLAGAAAILAGSLLVLGGGVAAHASPAALPQSVAPQVTAEVPAETTTTLPLFGAPLTIDVTSAPGGALSTVAVNPADGFTASTVKPNKVRFINEDGTAKVQVSSRGGGQKVEAKAGQLSDVTGPGGWSGDVFGTGATTTVGFEIVAAADGTPDITNVTTSDATAQIGAVDHKGRGDEQHARVTIRFTNGIEQRVLSIKVEVGSHDGESRAKVSVGLSDVKGQSLPAAEVIGAQVWNGILCDGSAAQISYTVNADGSISDVVANPATASVDTNDHGITVSFSDSERVKIRVKSSDDDARLRVSVDEKFRCDNADPSVNTPVDVTIDDGQHGHSGDGRDHDGDGGRDRDDNGSGGRDDGDGGGGHGGGNGD